MISRPFWGVGSCCGTRGCGKNNDDWTPLHLAAMYNADKIVLNDLISQGADVNARDQWGQTPLDVADSKEKKSILREAMKSLKPVAEPAG